MTFIIRNRAGKTCNGGNLIFIKCDKLEITEAELIHLKPCKFIVEQFLKILFNSENF